MKYYLHSAHSLPFYSFTSACSRQFIQINNLIMAASSCAFHRQMDKLEEGIPSSILAAGLAAN